MFYNFALRLLSSLDYSEVYYLIFVLSNISVTFLYCFLVLILFESENIVDMI